MEPKKPSWLPHTILIILLLFSLGLCAFYYFQFTLLQQQIIVLTTSLNPATVTPKPQYLTKTYQDQDFSLLIPETWQQQPPKTYGSRFETRFLSDQIQEVLSINIIGNYSQITEKPYQTLDEFLPTTSHDIESNVSIGNQTAKLISNPAGFQEAVLFSPDRQNLLLLIHTNQSSSDASHFSQILSTFRFIEPTPTTSNITSSTSDCIPGGCSGTICQEAGSRPQLDTCIYREYYACYKLTRCEHQTDGTCGWTPTSAFTNCMQGVVE